MKKIALLCVIFLFSYNVEAQEYVVIANKTVKELSSSQIKAIFLKKMSFVGDVKVIPVSLQVRDPLRKHFESHILKMSFSRLKSYWIKQHYLGFRPPISLKSEESVKSFVKRVDGAIGYINKENLDPGIKVLYSWQD